MNKTIDISVQLLGNDEGTFRWTKAIDLGDGTYKVLATPNYDPEEAIWEFPPNSIVGLRKGVYEGKEFLYAVKA